MCSIIFKPSQTLWRWRNREERYGSDFARVWNRRNA